MVAKGATVLSVGTRKGLFLIHSRDRKSWKTEGPFLEGVDCYHSVLGLDGKTVWATTSSMHWGPTVRSSRDWGAKWTQPPGPKYAKSSGLSVERIWNITPVQDGSLWAGVEPAGLFRSVDGGKSWEGVDGFNELGS